MNPQNKYSQFCYNIVVVYLKNPAKQKKYKHLFLHLISLVVERGLVDGCECFGGMYHLHLQGEVSHVWGGRCLCRQRTADGNVVEEKGASCHRGLEKSCSYMGPNRLCFLCSAAICSVMLFPK
jgi:hypothetical protein